MSLAVPTLIQELLRVCGTVGLPTTRPEVRGLRLFWFSAFAATKLGLVPLWLRHRDRPELNQPNLLMGKLSYFVTPNLIRTILCFDVNFDGSPELVRLCGS